MDKRHEAMLSACVELTQSAKIMINMAAAKLQGVPAFKDELADLGIAFGYLDQVRRDIMERRDMVRGKGAT